MTAVRALRVGTRASMLARAQTGQVVQSLQAASSESLDVEIVPVVTEGDLTGAALATIGGTGVFVTSLRRALLDGRIDLAVHSYKDLPTVTAEGLHVAAVPHRQDPRDALISRDGLLLAQLPVGATIGTGSPRRAAQLRALGLGLRPEPMRGNVDTRIGQVSAGRVDAVVLAAAGLRRLGRASQITELLEPERFLPAPAQGALALETRSDDAATTGWVGALDHLASRAAVLAERAVLSALEAGCSAPIGALAEPVGDDQLFLRASVTAVDGSAAIHRTATGPITAAEQIGRQLAADLRELGADSMMGSAT